MFQGHEYTNTKYLTGHLLGDFITEYCEAHNVFCDVDILNNAFGCTETYSEPEAVKLIEKTAAQWNLKALCPALQRKQ